MTVPRRFKIDIPGSVLEDLRIRLSRTRFPDQLESAEWSYGTELEYLKDLCAYWHDKFDWRLHESMLNRFDQYQVELDGLDLHFIHVRSPHPGALPILISHGWPGSIFEFYKIIGPLVDPVAHGADARDAFHVICPSLPGYGFSSAPRKPGFDVQAMAQSLASLMRELGYTRYGAQGGDWGAVLSTCLGDLDREHLCGIHLNMVLAGPPAAEEGSSPEISPTEQQALADMAQFMKNETGYQQIQGTKPQSLGYALNDSPAGLAAWIVEKFRTWTDCGGDLESCLTRDEVLTNITLYWVTESITSSMRLYCETMRAGRFGPMEGRVEVPTGAAIFPHELFRPPRAWAERRYNITRWTEMPRGGHFAALEQPDLLIDDIRAFFRALR